MKRAANLLILLALIAFIVAKGFGEDKQPVFLRTLTPPEKEEIADLISKLNKLRKQSNPTAEAVIIARLGEMRHVAVIRFIGERLSHSKHVCVRVEAANALGTVGSPVGAYRLINGYANTNNTRVKVACLCSLSAIAEYAITFGEENLILEARQKLNPMRNGARSYFASYSSLTSPMSDSIECWGNLLQLMEGDREVEKAIAVLLTSSSIKEFPKARLCRLLLRFPVKNADSISSAIKQEFLIAANTRYKSAILRVLGQLKRGRKLLTAVATGSPLVVLKRVAVTALTNFRSSLNPVELIGLLAEDDPQALERSIELMGSILRLNNIESFCRMALSHRKRKVASRACLVLRISIHNWQKGKKKAIWLKAVEVSSPLLLSIMESGNQIETNLRREAYLTWLALFPPGLEPKNPYEWEAPLEKRKKQVDTLKKESAEKDIKDNLHDSIERACETPRGPEPSVTLPPPPTPRTTPRRSEAPPPTPSRTITRRSIPPTPSPERSLPPQTSRPPVSVRPTPSPPTGSQKPPRTSRPGQLPPPPPPRTSPPPRSGRKSRPPSPSPEKSLLPSEPGH